MSSPRAPALVLLAGALVAGLVIDARRGPDGGPLAPGRERAVSAGTALPAAFAPGTLSSTWYCPGGTATPGGGADYSVVIANPRPEAVTGAITFMGGTIATPPPAPPDEGGPAPPEAPAAEAPAAEAPAAEAPAVEAPAAEAQGGDLAAVAALVTPVSRELVVPARGRVEVRAGDVLDAQVAGAVVEVPGGEVAVEQVVTGDLGRSTAPCATAAADEWSFPWGVTSRGNRMLAVFLNPFPDDATLDVTFVTDEGDRKPGRFDGFVVPGRSVAAAYVDDSLRREQLSTRVEVRSGRIVAGRIALLSGEGGLGDHRRGMAVGLGVAEPAETWVFPDGEVREGVSQQFVVFNPTRSSAEVSVEVRLADPAGEDPEPFGLTIPPGRFSLLELSGQERLPPGQPHASIVRSLNGVPVVAERVLAAVEPAARRGIAATTGSPLAARNWLLAAGGAGPELDQWVTILNLSDDSPARVTLTGLSEGQLRELPGLTGLEAPPAGRLALRIGEHHQQLELPLVVESSTPIVVERGLFRVDGLGMSTAIGIPRADTATALAPLAGP